MTLEQGDGLESDGWMTRVIRKNRDNNERIKRLEGALTAMTNMYHEWVHIGGKWGGIGSPISFQDCEQYACKRATELLSPDDHAEPTEEK